MTYVVIGLLIVALAILLLLRADERERSPFNTPEFRRSRKRLIEDYDKRKADARLRTGDH